jgi:cholesterol transport system auxiliary component
MKDRDNSSPQRRRILRGALALPAGLLLAGCGSFLPTNRPPPRYFRLTPKNTFDPDLPDVDWQLILETPTADAALDTTRLALMRSPHEIEYYARANWTDRTPQMVQTLMVESFENSRHIVSVGRESIGLRADFRLKSELREFHAEYFEGGLPKARVGLNIKLVAMPRRVIVASTDEEAVIEAERDDIEAVVEAFDQALGKVLKVLVAWTIRAGEEHHRQSTS